MIFEFGSERVNRFSAFCGGQNQNETLDVASKGNRLKLNALQSTPTEVLYKWFLGTKSARSSRAHEAQKDPTLRSSHQRNTLARPSMYFLGLGLLEASRRRDRC